MVNRRIKDWFHNLQVQQKIALGYGLSLGIAIVGTAIGILLTDQQQRWAEALGRDALEELQLLTRLQVDALEVSIHQDNVEESLSDPERLPLAYVEWRQDYNRYRQVWQEFKETENHTKGEEEVESAEELSALEMFFEQYGNLQDKYFQTFDQLPPVLDPAAFTPDMGIRFKAALDKLEQRAFSQQTHDLTHDLTNLTALIRDEYELAQVAILNASTLRLWLISFTMVGSAAIAGLLSILTARAIASPIRKLTLMTQQLAQGNVDVRIPMTGKDEVGRLGKAFNQMAEQLAESGLLNQQIQQLHQTLGDLEKNQAKLIHAEKMSSLGQLVAGIAHEINTPLGVIQASIGNMTAALKQSLRELPPLLQTLPPAQLADFLTLLAWTRQPQELLSSREERQLKRRIQQTLIDLGLANADILAETLSRMSIMAPLDPILPLLKTANAPTLLETAYQLAIIQNNSQNIHLAVGQATRIVYALKNYVRQDVMGVPIYASISDGINTVLTLYQNQIKRGIKIEKKYAALPPVLCHPEELIQVWSNLISNAIQAMNYRGNLTITTAEQAQYVVVQITDMGDGIPPEIQARIFEPFFTTKAVGEGTGLGLSIVKNIVDKHHGKIELESIPGHTTFTVRLPLDPASVEIAIAEKESYQKLG
ncbi:MAG: HAMP domain-containing protein [Cyanobacteria bacterium RM1_2_2]|nr:HAMP domain-containing protein [Cyanobacteria bacterium RM1_2_2]